MRKRSLATQLKARLLNIEIQEESLSDRSEDMSFDQKLTEREKRIMKKED